MAPAPLFVVDVLAPVAVVVPLPPPDALVAALVLLAPAGPVFVFVTVWLPAPSVLEPALWLV